MAKLTLSDVTNLENETTAVATINANSALIETALENTLSRDGTSPNTMGASLDMNSNRILNLPAAVGSTEPVRKAEFDAATSELADLSDAVADAEAAQAAAEAAQAAAEAAQAAAELAASQSQEGTIADNAVTNAKMADNAVNTAEIVNGAVTNAKLADMGNNLIKARKTASTGVPEDCTLSQVLDFLTVTRGSIFYRGSSSWLGLGPGTAGQVLQTNGAGADPSWVTPAANPTGTIIAFADDAAPTGYLECDGSAVSRSTYSALFAVVGTTWGAGNGSTTFNVPDLRGEFLRGWDHGKGTDSGRTFASSQSEMIGPHSHTASSSGSTSSDGAHTHTVSVYDSAGGSLVPQTANTGGSPAVSATTSSSGAHTHTVSVSTTVNNNSGTENRVRNYAVMFCIKT